MVFGFRNVQCGLPAASLGEVKALRPMSKEWGGKLAAIVTRTLFNTDQGMLPYAFKGFLLVLLPTILMVLLIQWIAPDSGEPEFDQNPAVAFFDLIFFAPIVETLLMWPLIALLRLLSKSTWVIALLSALCWSACHSSEVAAWGIAVFPLFVALSICFVEWWKNRSALRALCVTSMFHMIHNTCFFTLMMLEKAAE